MSSSSTALGRRGEPGSVPCQQGLENPAPWDERPKGVGLVSGRTRAPRKQPFRYRGRLRNSQPSVPVDTERGLQQQKLDLGGGNEVGETTGDDGIQSPLQGDKPLPRSFREQLAMGTRVVQVPPILLWEHDNELRRPLPVSTSPCKAVRAGTSPPEPGLFCSQPGQICAPAAAPVTPEGGPHVECSRARADYSYFWEESEARRSTRHLWHVALRKASPPIIKVRSPCVPTPRVPQSAAALTRLLLGKEKNKNKREKREKEEQQGPRAACSLGTRHQATLKQPLLSAEEQERLRTKHGNFGRAKANTAALP